ncbi:MAG: protoporphyrinogen oxidase [Chloroflexi bacterium]|nr:protoporphyrinogen oxidase [Chloroflexota bacterium]
MTETFDVVIVGGGIAGLSTAWYLERNARATKNNLRYALLEESKRWGGHIFTERISANGSGEFIVEAGPDSFLTQKPWALQLARELGLADELLGTNDKQRQVYVLNRGKPTVMPDGVLLIVPTKFTPFALSPLLSPLGKLRMGLDLLLPAKRDGKDETLADFVRRRLGSEALDKIAEPLLSGIYNSEAEKQSLLATFPRFRALEVQYGSLTRGMLESRRTKNGNGDVHNPLKSKPMSAFVSFRGGTEDLVTSLVPRLHGDLRLSTTVRRIERQDDAYVITTNKESIRARAVVMATPAFVAAQLLCELAPNVAKDLQTIRYVSTGTISLAYRTSDIRRPLNGFGLVVPRSERRPINAVTASSIKFDQRAPEGYTLLRAFFGGSRSPQSMDLDDEQLVQVVRDQLRELMGIENAPLFQRIYRWNRSNAQYDVGHLDRLVQIESALPKGIYLTGSAYRGVGIPDCVKQSQDTVQNILCELKKQ